MIPCQTVARSLHQYFVAPLLHPRDLTMGAANEMTRARRSRVKVVCRAMFARLVRLMVGRSPWRGAEESISIPMLCLRAIRDVFNAATDDHRLAGRRERAGKFVSSPVRMRASSLAMHSNVFLFRRSHAVPVSRWMASVVNRVHPQLSATAAEKFRKKLRGSVKKYLSVANDCSIRISSRRN